ncbi:hypothetical protein RDI58_026533 [Solanum bulbocastanum]
MPESGIEEVFA